LKGDFPVYAAEVNLNIACKSYFHILQPFVFAKVISAVAGFGVGITFSNEFLHLPAAFFSGTLDK